MGRRPLARALPGEQHTTHAALRSAAHPALEFGVVELGGGSFAHGRLRYGDVDPDEFVLGALHVDNP